MTVTRYRWNGSELVDVTGAPQLPLYVGDSFLLSEGTVVGYHKHLDRFAHSADAQGLVRPVDDFLTAVTTALPRTGQWFPRIDLTERGELELLLRPAPPLTETLVAATAQGDPRTEPTIKGPDIEALNTLRESAHATGADEAIIVDTHGRVIDGATTCLVWFRGTTLYTPPVEATRLESTTVAVVTEMATEAGFTIATQWATPSELSGLNVWALNALHGIRGITSWVNGPALALDASMLSGWRAKYDALAQPVAV